MTAVSLHTSPLATLDAQCAPFALLCIAVWIFDIDRRRILWANAAALQVWRADSLAELRARDLGLDMSPSVAQRLVQYQHDFVAQDARFNEQWTVYPAGIPVALTVCFSGYRLEDGRMAMLCEASNNAHMAPAALRSVEALLHTAVMITLYATDGSPLYRNPAARAALASPQESLAEHIADAQAHARFMAELAAHGVAKHTLRVTTPQGECWHELSARHCKDAVTGHNAILVSETDISTVKQTEERAQHQALHDTLTGLPNRSYVLKRFQQMQAHVQSTAHTAVQEAALIFIDLDHFKDVNDTLGHAVGDALLVQIAQRLRQVTRSTDLVARLGGDEFLIFLTTADLHGELAQIKTRLLQTVAQPVFLAGNEIRVTPSAGVALYPRDGSDIDTLMRNADLAMYAAKENGRNGLAYYHPRMSEALHSRTELETELRQAVERNEFTVYFQPRVELATGRITGAEALVRWQHPVRGLLPPGVFIPTCERTGLIRPIGNFVLQQAAAQQARWAQAGHDLLVSVNLSAYQLMHPALLADISAALTNAQGQAHRLELEITESMLLGNDPQLAERLNAIQRMGFSIALDDFGTGYSNLAYLQRFPITTLKIDKTFIQCGAADRRLTSVITALCKLMGYTSVAEGVETVEQLAWVLAQGITQYQGYLHTPPITAAAFTALLAAPSPLAASPSSQAAESVEFIRNRA